MKGSLAHREVGDHEVLGVRHGRCQKCDAVLIPSHHSTTRDYDVRLITDC